LSSNIRPWRGVLPTLGQRVYVDPAAVVIGQVTLGDDSVGARTSVQDGSVLHVTHDGPYWPGGFALAVGDDVTVGHRVVLHGCTVGNRCLVGMGAIVMDGAMVEDEVIIGAGAIVTPGSRCESRFLYVGSPARRIRPLTDKEVGQLAYSAGWYVKVKDGYL
jgi:carbonic anhydrase/acetyltransferase-like protein (isoleucine patch superfamily)